MQPMQFQFEEMMPNFRLNGSAAIYEGQVPTPSLDNVDPTNSARILRAGQDWWVLATWRQEGWLNHAIGGTWHLRVYFEQMGLDEFQLMSNPVDVAFVSRDPHTYFKALPFPATRQAVPPGLYKPTFSLTMSGPAGVALPVAAVAEGPVIQFYEVGP